jgi:hypothetical protein
MNTPGVALALTLVTAAAPALAQNRYSIRRIAPVAGHLGAEATAIDGAGRVVGTSQTVTAFLFQAGVTSPLPDWMGGSTSRGHGIGPNGEVLGDALGPSFWNVATIWTPAGAGFALTALPPDAGDLESTANAMNLGGTVVGVTDNLVHPQPAVWELVGSAYTVTTLPLALPQHFGGAALAIDPASTVVGYTGNPSGNAAVLWSQSGAGWTATPLPALGGSSEATDINAAGEICGSAWQAGAGWRMVGWTSPTTVVNLGGLPGADTRAHAMNAQGDVVGSAGVGPAQTAVVRIGGLATAAPVEELHPLIPPDGLWSRLIVANDINDRGEIVGMGVQGSFRHAFVLTPVALNLSVSPALAGATNTWSVTGATPGNVVFFLIDDTGGEVIVPGCTPAVDLAGIEIIGSAAANAAGVASISLFVPDSAQGQPFLFQAYELAGCKNSDVPVVVF